MTMRPLSQEERAGMRERLGDAVMRRLDALVVAGYALHAVGVDDPADNSDRWHDVADYLLGEECAPSGGTPGGIDSGAGPCLVDADGNAWLPLGDDGAWECITRPGRAGSRLALVAAHGPVREVTR